MKIEYILTYEHVGSHCETVCHFDELEHANHYLENLKSVSETENICFANIKLMRKEICQNEFVKDDLAGSVKFNYRKFDLNYLAEVDNLNQLGIPLKFDDKKFQTPKVYIQRID